MTHEAEVARQSIEIDELKHAVFSLRITSEMLSKVSQDPRYWIWVIISLHNSLQGFMVTALRSGLDIQLMGLSYMKQREQKWWKDYERAMVRGDIEKANELEKDLKEPDLVGFMDLYKKIKCEKFMETGRYDFSKRFEPTPEQDTSCLSLRAVRNSYIHFSPRISFVDPSHFPCMVVHCLETIDFLVFKSGNIYCEEPMRSDLLNMTKEIRAVASGLGSRERSD